MRRIAFFNHKGGVSKTTTVFNLGWMLAEKGHRVLMVDTDPQCNLTGMILGYKGPSELEAFYSEHSDQTIMSGLAPAFESRPAPISAVDCLEVPARDGLFLLPGHIRLAEYEVTLGIAQELSAAIQALQNLPGSLAFLLNITAARYEADYVLIDMSPGLGPINQNLFSTADYFLVPTSPDFFSVMAIDSLARVIPRWQRWAVQAYSLEVLKEAAYPFPEPHSKFLGTVVQKYRPRRGSPARAFQRWIDEIKERVNSTLVPELEKAGMLLPADRYSEVGITEDYCLATIADFNSLIAKSQAAQAPVFALTESQLGQSGRVLEQTTRSRNQFREEFAALADRVIDLTDATGTA
jgi:cellulose biosynthesis protein BcsQ